MLKIKSIITNKSFKDSKLKNIVHKQVDLLNEQLIETLISSTLDEDMQS